MRIAGQFIDASTGAHIWADRDGAIEDIFDLQQMWFGLSNKTATSPRRRG
jgi:TolB-like protein